MASALWVPLWQRDETAACTCVCGGLWAAPEGMVHLLAAAGVTPLTHAPTPFATWQHSGHSMAAHLLFKLPLMSNVCCFPPPGSPAARFWVCCSIVQAQPTHPAGGNGQVCRAPSRHCIPQHHRPSQQQQQQLSWEAAGRRSRRSSRCCHTPRASICAHWAPHTPPGQCPSNPAAASGH